MLYGGAPHKQLRSQRPKARKAQVDTTTNRLRHERISVSRIELSSVSLCTATKLDWRPSGCLFPQETLEMMPRTRNAEPWWQGYCIERASGQSYSFMSRHENMSADTPSFICLFGFASALSRAMCLSLSVQKTSYDKGCGGFKASSSSTSYW